MLIRRGKIFVPESPLAGFVFVILAVLICYLLWVASWITATYYDTFDIWINSRQLTGGEGIYYWKRAAFLPILLSPYFLMERVFEWEGFAPRAARVTAVLLFLLFLNAVHRFLRSVGGRQTALIALLLVACNRVVIHTAPFSKEGIPGALFLTLFFYFYWKSVDQPRAAHIIRAGLCLTGAILTRYYFFPLVLVIVLAHELIHARARRLVLTRGTGFLRNRLFQDVLYYVLLPGLLFMLVFSFYCGILEPLPLWEAPARVLNNIKAHMVGNLDREPPYQNYAFWLKSTHWLVIGYFFIGFLIVWFKRHPLKILMTLWLGVLFFVQTYVAGHKEARYLIPMLPPFCFFAASGVQWLLAGLKRIVPRFNEWRAATRVWMETAVILALLIPPLVVGGREALHFRDPFYRSTFAQDVGCYAKELSAGNNLFWLGVLYSLHPQEYVFHPEDEQFYIYHFHANGLSFYADKVLPFEVGGLSIYSDNLAEGLFVDGIGDLAHDGDVLVVNTERYAYRSKYIPPKLKPIVVEKMRKLTFRRAMHKNGRSVFICRKEPRAMILSTPSEQGWALVGGGIPLRRAAATLKADGQTLAVVPNIPVGQGQFVAAVNDKGLESFNEIVLIGYTHIRVFYPPGM